MIKNPINKHKMNEKDITERIRTFADACKELGLDPENLPIVEHLPEKDRKSIIAYYKLIVITRALNEGWEADFRDKNQYKFWSWFYIASYGAHAGFGCATTYSTPSLTYTAVGARLCLKTQELAMYASGQFRDLYFECLFIDMPKNYGK
jgi:hypothetical protein